MSRVKLGLCVGLAVIGLGFGVWYQLKLRREAEYSRRWWNVYHSAAGDVVRLHPDHPIVVACLTVHRLDLIYGGNAVDAVVAELEGPEPDFKSDEEIDAYHPTPYRSLVQDARGDYYQSGIYYHVQESEEQGAQQLLLIAESLERLMIVKFGQTPEVERVAEQTRAWDAGRLRVTEQRVGPKPR